MVSAQAAGGPDRAPSDGFTTSVERMRASTAALLGTVAGWSDADCAEPSALPGWTRGHVLTHLARVADALGNLVGWARTGVETPMYASREARAAAIEAGADRPAAVLRADLEQSAARLDEALDGLAEQAAADPAVLGVAMTLASGATIDAVEIPMLRRREVEIHHADLAAGYGPDDWPADFVREALGILAPAALAGREVGVGALVAADGDGRWPVGAGPTELSGPPGQLLAWLVGRGTGPALTVAPPGSVPPSPAWV